MKKIGIIDADIIGRKNHRFPNLACMKISGYYQKIYGGGTELIESYDLDELKEYDKIYLSKVFTDTKVPQEVLELNNVSYGGTGFYFDKAPELPYEIEHSMPDYHLYNNIIKKFVQEKKEELLKLGKPFDEKQYKNKFKFYTDYSIGFTTRGCFRKCGFCVNQKYNHVFKHSPLEEFYDPTRKKICLLDDNILGYKDWKRIFSELIAIGKPFKYRQGLDERLLTDEKCELLFNCKYDGQITFAFDDINDYDLIHKKIELIKKYTDKVCTFYVLCGFDKNNGYDDSFYYYDILNTFKRIELLQSYHFLPYIMRFEQYNNAPEECRGMYINLARWCNQPNVFKKKSFDEFCHVKENAGATIRYYDDFKRKYKGFPQDYFHMKW